MENMSIYNSGRAVPAEAQKEFSNGSFSGTDINPMWRIKKLTELFGPCGLGWYYEVLSERCEEHAGTTIAVVDLNLYIKADGEWSKPIYGTGGNQIVKQTKTGARVSDEGYKMALTDALSVACKALGIGADIYFSKDKTKYTAYTVKDEPAPEDEVRPETPLELPKAEEWKPRVEAAKWAVAHGLTMQEFANMRKAVIAAGLAADIEVKDLTQEQLETLCRAIELNRRNA